MGVDILDLIDSKGGNSEAVRESQRRRNASVELVDECIEMYGAWVKMGFELDMARKEINKTQKAITEKKKAKEDAEELLTEKKKLEASEAQLKESKQKIEAELDKKVGTIGNFVHSSVPTSHTEDDNLQIKTWHPDGPNAQVEKKEGIFSHHEVMYKLDILEQERGTKVAGHRGFFLINDGVDLNQALISYGLNFLRTKNYKKVMTPFMMKRNMMAKTAQLSEFDEALYKLEGAGDDDDEKYLIATSEQPLSAFHADEWLQDKELPHKYAGYSTCFRKEAGSHGRDTWGIFRIHQFEKIEQFCVTDPEKSWETFDLMCEYSEEFYQSLKLPYQVVAIVSGALNNAAAKKHDLEAWFPYQGEYKELVSVSNCLDYQSRSLNVRCGAVTKGQERKKYVHMLNGTLCATERALCCVVENYQTPEGLVIPEVLRPYMGGRDFIPYVKSDLPKGSASTKPAAKKK